MVLLAQVLVDAGYAEADRYYLELKRGGVAAEPAIFPGKDHELNWGATPRRRLQRLQRLQLILDWRGRYLPFTSGPCAQT